MSRSTATDAGPGSRLTRMQAQFQQKQIKEKEQKLLQMLESQQQKAYQKAALSGVLPPKRYDTISGPGTPMNGNLAAHQPGKVRQMFEERRKTGVMSNLSANVNGNGYTNGRNGGIIGIDKGYPLEPIITPLPKAQSRTSSSKSDPTHHAIYSKNARNTAGSLPPVQSKRGISLERPTTLVSRDSSSTTRRSDDMFPTTKYVDSVAKRETALSNKLKRMQISPEPLPSVTKTPSSPIRRTTPTLAKPAVAKLSAPKSPAKKTAPAVRSGPPPGTEECKVCGRYFNSDRIDKHQSICKKTTTKKRKVFDPTKMRMKGTEAEPYIRKVAVQANKPAAPQPKKQDWRKKHEEFIKTIRAAKEYQNHVAKGGNPNDLPPPPPTDTSDYVQCPYCSRKFSEGVADRHIPKCKNIKSNKR